MRGLSRKTLLWSSALFVIALLAVFLFLWPGLMRTNVPNDSEPRFVTIATGADFRSVLDSLSDGCLMDPSTFAACARLTGYASSPKAGKYRLEPGWSNLRILVQLIRGDQEPVRLTINNVRTLEELCGRMSRRIEPDSGTLLLALQSPELIDAAIGLQADSALCLFIPNTYEVWWTITPDELARRMWQENRKFWEGDRLAKASALGLTPTQVYILASIVEKETLVKSEKPTIAGVYLNRLRTGMPLQADPTVVFALRGFQRERVLFEDLTYDSPYNTYLYSGLPPGPICMPEIGSIDAVLNAENHEYLFFCARADNSGAHVFATTLREHARNAQRFRKWLNERGILR